MHSVPRSPGELLFVLLEVCLRAHIAVLRDMIPSFVLMDVQGPSITIYVYQYFEDDVKVKKFEYHKR